MKIKAIPYEAVKAGEFVDKETGEVIKWADGCKAHVFLPDYEYPFVIKIKGSFPIGQPLQCDLRIKVNKERLQVQISDFEPWQDADTVKSPAASAVKSPL